MRSTKASSSASISATSRSTTAVTSEPGIV
jgi:hypothetical protein